MPAVFFPILRLPESALQKSLKQMNLQDQLSLSVLSKNTKRLVTTVNKNPISAEVNMKSTSISLRLYDRSFKTFEFILNPNQSNVEIREYSNNAHESTWLNVSGFTEKQWFEHITQVLFKNKYTSLSITDSPGRSIEKVCEYTKELKVGELRVQYSKIQNYELHKLFPSLRKLNVHGQDSLPKSILNQSLEDLNLPMMNVTLDDLLGLNHSNFSVHAENFSDNDMNLFLKNWIKGSNPNLKHLSVYRSNHQQEFNDNIFYGIEGANIMEGGFAFYDPCKRMFKFESHVGTEAFGVVDTSRSSYFTIQNCERESEPCTQVLLIVDQQSFYASKAVLSNNSAYFRSVLAGPSLGSDEKPILILKDINPDVFQKFLRVLNGEAAIFERTYYEILLLAVLLQTPVVVKKCEKFLIHMSTTKLQTKFALAEKYNLTDLQIHCEEELQIARRIRKPIAPKALPVYEHSFRFESTFEWFIDLCEKDNHLRISLCCQAREPNPYWLVRADFQLVLPGRDLPPVTKGLFSGSSNFIELGREIEMEEIEERYLVDGCLKVEALVNVIFIKGTDRSEVHYEEKKKTTLMSSLKKILTRRR